MPNESSDMVMRMSQLSNDDLLKIITFDASDYRDEAIVIAKEELRRRGIETVDVEKLNELKSASDLARVPVKWLTFYTYFLLPIGVLGGLIGAFATTADESASFPIVAGAMILLSLFAVAVVIGLHKRRLWGWRLNWSLLALNALVGPVHMAKGVGSYFILLALYAVVYFWPQYVYFKKRRSLFDLTEQEAARLPTNAER